MMNKIRMLSEKFVEKYMAVFIKGMKKALNPVRLFFILLFINIPVIIQSQVVHYHVVPQAKISFQRLKKEFKAVPDEYRLRSFWLWLNGIATKKSITQDLEAMKAKGFGGAIIADNGAKDIPSGPVFMSSAWLELFTHAVKEADRIGMELSINIQSGMGDPGNPTIQPENSMKKVVFSEIVIKGPAKIRDKIPTPPSQYYYEDITLQAFRNNSRADSFGKIKNWDIKTFNKEVPWDKEADRFPMQLFHDDFPDSMKYLPVKMDEVIDLGKYFSNDTLRWEVPSGEWTIVRYGMTSTGKRNNYASAGYSGGFCYDQINHRGVEAQWNDVAKPLIELAKSSGNSLKFVHTDSWEMGLTNWTEGFMEKFKKRRGYDLNPYLPVLTNKIVKNREISNRFLEDFRLTIGELVADENYGRLKKAAHENGVLLHSESGGPHAAPIDGLQTLGRNDIPMGEFWGRSDSHRTTEGRRMVVKQASSAGHIYGKRFIAAEGPTTVGPAWERSPKDLKGLIDQVFCNGINRIYWHTYTSSPDEYGLPGIEYFAGTHLNRKVTWWEQSGPFIDYINRCQYMLSQGLYVADVLNYHGNDVPHFVLLDSDVKLPKGYAWDMCNSEVLLSGTKVKDGQIYLSNGMNYRILYLPEQDAISLPVLKKIEQMVKDGIILCGEPPKRAYGLCGFPESDAEVKVLTKRLWGDTPERSGNMNRYGRGKVYRDKDIEQVMKLEKIVPDFLCDADLNYIHRTTDSTEIYFITNKWSRHGINDFIYRYLPDVPNRYVFSKCSFRVEGEREVERWDPMTGEMTPVKIYKRENNYYKIPVALPPEGSAFFVFKKSSGKAHLTEITKDGSILEEGNDPLIPGASCIFVQDQYVEVGKKGRYLLTWNNGRQKTIDNQKDPNEYFLDGTWRIDFMENPLLGDQSHIETDTLKSWTAFDHPAIKYFSGMARYSKSFNLRSGLKENKKVFLDLGNVQELATIRLNGVMIKTCWVWPFRADITDYLQSGENNIEIEVTNLWANRLVGDGKIDKDIRLTKTNIKKFDDPITWKNMRVSGLLGPVKLQFVPIYKIND